MMSTICQKMLNSKLALEWNNARISSQRTMKKSRRKNLRHLTVILKMTYNLQLRESAEVILVAHTKGVNLHHMSQVQMSHILQALILAHLIERDIRQKNVNRLLIA